MLWIGRALGVLSGLFCLSCAPQVVTDQPEGAADLPARKAFFTSDPAVLHEVFRTGCAGPGDRYTQPDFQTARCAILPTPEGAAFLLLEFDAGLETPKLIVQKVTRRSGDGYEVEMSYFAQIRSKSGKRQRIYMQRKSLDRQIDLILESTGGTRLAGP